MSGCFYMQETATRREMSHVANALPPMPSEPPNGCPMAPPTAFSVMRDSDPVSKVTLGDGTVVWLLTRYADVRAVLADPRFSSVTTRPGFPIYGLPGRDTPEFARSIIRRDRPEHMRLRRLATKEFMPKQVRKHEADVFRIVTEHLDALETKGPPGDFVEGFAMSVPSTVISLLLGIPQEDHAVFQDATQRLTSRHGSVDDVADALVRLNGYMLELADVKEKDPRDDVLSRLVRQRVEGNLTRDEVASYATLLVSAGHDTTAGALALSILTLLERPHHLARLKDDPSLWDVAVEELLRYHSVVRGGPRRLALEDAEVGGQLIREGEGVMVSIWAANHDDRQFDTADRIEIERANAESHLAFGFGSHQCMGQSLARLEMRIGLSEVFRRFPDLAVDGDVAALPFRKDTTNYGLHAMPLTWSTQANGRS